MNGQYIRYTGADSWGTLPSNPFLTRAQYLRRQAAATIVATRTEELAKTDAVTNEDEIARKVMNAGKTIANGLCGDLYSDGSELNQMDGLQKIIADNAGGTELYAWLGVHVHAGKGVPGERLQAGGVHQGQGHRRGHLGQAQDCEPDDLHPHGAAADPHEGPVQRARSEPARLLAHRDAGDNVHFTRADTVERVQVYLG